MRRSMISMDVLKVNKYRLSCEQPTEKDRRREELGVERSDWRLERRRMQGEGVWNIYICVSDMELGYMVMHLIWSIKGCFSPKAIGPLTCRNLDLMVTIFVKLCQEQIDVLKNSINDEEANSRGWLGIRDYNMNADTVAHKHGVVLILSEKLRSVASQFDKLRAVCFQDAINRVTSRKKLMHARKENLAQF